MWTSNLTSISSWLTSIPVCWKTLRAGTTLWFRGLKSPPYKYFIIIISLLLFFSYFFTRNRIAVRKYYSCSNSVDHPVDGIESRFCCSPLLYYDYWPVPGIQGHGIELLLSSNIAPRFQNTEHKESCPPDLSGQKWDIQNAKHLNKRGRIYRPCIHSRANLIVFLLHTF
jgi:hypothetical protein